MIERLKELEKKATKGPWSVASSPRNRPLITNFTGYALVNSKSHPIEPPAKFICDVRGPGNEYSGSDETEANAALIVALRNAAPLLIAVAEAAETSLDSTCDPEVGPKSELIGPPSWQAMENLRIALRALKESKS